MLAVDVFSGTGGISLALRGLVHTLQYCEINPYCQAVLSQRMKEGKLDKAPIHADISTLHISPLTSPNMIVGGFPCQDISSMGLQNGIAEGTRSGLFLEIMRIVDECPSIHAVFLENVHNILKCGIQEVITELAARGFHFQWTTRSAGSMGAPHVRSRWFCLAVRKGVTLPPILLPNPGTHPNPPSEIIQEWTPEAHAAIPPVVFKPAFREDPLYDDNWSLRCQCLGNAVVPAVVRQAFLELYEAHTHWESIAQCLRSSAIPLQSLQNRGDNPVSIPESGLVIDDLFYSIPKAFIAPKPNAIPIVVTFQDKRLEMIHYPTPRRGITHASTLTERSLRDLPTILLNSEHASNYLANLPDPLRQDAEGLPLPRHQIMIANPMYIEWMMGYEPNWTRISAPFKRTPQAPARPQERQPAPELQHDADATQVGSEDDEQPPVPTNVVIRATKRSSINGMHLFMRDRTGLPIPEVSKLWRALTDAERAEYGARAKALRNITPS